jgi:hypothetical protein
MLYAVPTGDSVNFELLLYSPPAGNAVNFDLSEISLESFLLGFYISGNIGKVGDPDPLGINGIYQMRMTTTGKRPIKMKFYTPTNPQTEPQEANRSKFATAMSEWMSLSSGDKAVYNARAKKRNMFGHGLFIREYYQSHP